MVEPPSPGANWIPRLATVKRIAGRLLRAHRGGHLDIGGSQVDSCVEVLTRGFVPTHLRRIMGAMWLKHGAEIAAGGWEEPTRRKPVDDELDAMVPPVVE